MPFDVKYYLQYTTTTHRPRFCGVYSKILQTVPGTEAEDVRARAQGKRSMLANQVPCRPSLKAAALRLLILTLPIALVSEVLP